MRWKDWEALMVAERGRIKNGWFRSGYLRAGFRDAWLFFLVSLIRLRAGLRTRIDEAVLKVGHKYKAAFARLLGKPILETLNWNGSNCSFLSFFSGKKFLIIAHWDGKCWSIRESKCDDWKTNFFIINSVLRANLNLCLEWNYLLKYHNVNYIFQELRYFKPIFGIILLIRKLDLKYILGELRY